MNTAELRDFINSLADKLIEPEAGENPDFKIVVGCGTQTSFNVLFGDDISSSDHRMTRLGLISVTQHLTACRDLATQPREVNLTAVLADLFGDVEGETEEPLRN